MPGAAERRTIGQYALQSFVEFGQLPQNLVLAGFDVQEQADRGGNFAHAAGLVRKRAGSGAEMNRGLAIRIGLPPPAGRAKLSGVESFASFARLYASFPITWNCKNW